MADDRRRPNAGDDAPVRGDRAPSCPEAAGRRRRERPATAARRARARTPKERRRRRAPPRPPAPARAAPRTPEERQAERDAGAPQGCRAPRRAVQARAGKGQGAARTTREPTPPREHAPGVQKIRQGVVVSDKADKTITVRIDTARRHRRYQKIVRTSTHAARPRREQRRAHRRHRDRARVPAAVAHQALAAGRGRGAANDPERDPAAGRRQHRRPRDPRASASRAARAAAMPASAT